MIWRVSGDRNRATQTTGRSGQAFALVVGLFGFWTYATGGGWFALVTLLLAFFLYQAAGAAVIQGALGRRIKDITVADIMDREPVTIPAEVTLLDAQEQFFLRHHWPWFAVVDPTRHFLGVVRQQRVESEIAAGRPALPVVDVLEEDLPVRIGEEAPLESLLGSEGLGRLGRNGGRRQRRRPARRRHARAGPQRAASLGAAPGDMPSGARRRAHARARSADTGLRGPLVIESCAQSPVAPLSFSSDTREPCQHTTS